MINHIINLVSIILIGIRFILAQTDHDIENTIDLPERQIIPAHENSEEIILDNPFTPENKFEFIPVFSAQVNNEFWPNAFIGSSTQLSIAFGDLDDDGDLDLIQGSRYRMEWIENTGTSVNAHWDSIKIGNIVSNSNNFWTPELIDIDNDTDLDLFCGTLLGPLSYWQNIGNSQVPVWNYKQTNYGNFSLGLYSRPIFCDIDNDADYDLFIGTDGGIIHYYLNTGTAQSPLFEKQNGSLVNTGIVGAVYPEFVDIDADSDFDLFIGTKYGKIISFKNTGTPENAEWFMETNQYENINLGYSDLQPRFADIDNDFDKDLFFNDLDGFFYFYRNIGDKYVPVWDKETFCYNKILNFGRPSAPAAGDIDKDGDFDIIIGTHHLCILKNTGTDQTPAWEWNGTQAVYLNSFWVVPELADIDSDQDLDLFVGTTSGDLHHYENIGTPYSPLWTLRTTNYSGIKYTSNSHVSISFNDIDDDNDLDMFIQHFSCSPCKDSLLFYKNIGTPAQPAWELISDNYMSIGSYGISYGTNDFGDLDRDGDFDCILGNGDGYFYYMENTGDTDSAVWNYQGEIASGLLGEEYYSTPVLVDLNNDGWLDIVSGLDGGGLNLFLNNSNAASSLKNNGNIEHNFSLYQNYPNPFNPYTTIRFNLPAAEKVLLEIYDILGQKVKVLINGFMSAGYHEIRFDANDFATGIYFYKIQTNTHHSIKKMVLTR